MKTKRFVIVVMSLVIFFGLGSYLPRPGHARSLPRQATAIPPRIDIFEDFEQNSVWKRGDEANGEFYRSSAQAYSGGYAGQLDYTFPSTGNDYVVFMNSYPLVGRPNAISAWVKGDGQGHFLNLWIKDAGGQVWQMSFGQVKHTGWQPMTASLDPQEPWPSGHISGPDNGLIDYPISFYGLVLDDAPDSFSGQGSITIDDLTTIEGSADSPFTLGPAPSPTPPGGGFASSLYALRMGNQHRYEQPWGGDRGDPCEAYRTGNFDDTNPNHRGFHLELMLSNYSDSKVQDDWGENLDFITAGGKRLTACYYGYDGMGPAPKGTTSTTFFTVVPAGDYVRVAELTLNGELIRLCFDGAGGSFACQAGQASVNPGPAATPAPSQLGGGTASGLYALRMGNQHRYEQPWGGDRGDPCEAWRTGNFDDTNPNHRGFNLELMLSNYSNSKVPDDWGENLDFITAGGKRLTACYYGYDGMGPPPKGTTSATFFTVVPAGDFVRVAELSLNGELIRLCFDGAGGSFACR